MCDNLIIVLGSKGQKLLSWMGENVRVYLNGYIPICWQLMLTSLYIKKEKK